MDAAALLERRLRQGTLTARGYQRVHRLARTIADLDDAPVIEAAHACEALLFRVERTMLLGERE